MILYNAEYMANHWKQIKEFNAPKHLQFAPDAYGRLKALPQLPPEPPKQYPFNGKWPTRIYYKITYRRRKKQPQQPDVVYVGKPSVSAIRRMYNALKPTTSSILAAEFDRKQMIEMASLDVYQLGLALQAFAVGEPIRATNMPLPIFKSYHFFETNIRGIFSSFMQPLEAKRLAGQRVYRPANTVLTVAQVKAAHIELAKLGFKKAK